PLWPNGFLGRWQTLGATPEPKRVEGLIPSKRTPAGWLTPSEGFFGSSAIVRGIARCSREQQQEQSLTPMLRHILPKLLDGQLRSVNVASLGQASRERIELRRLWRWNRLRLALFIYHLSELTISVQIVKLYPYCCAFSLVNHSLEAGASFVMYS